MNWRAHLFIGISCGAAAAYLLGLDLQGAALFCAICALSSLLPDLDARTSKASQLAYAAALAAIAALAWQGSLAKGGSAAGFLFAFAILGAAFLAAGTLLRPRHRGLMHGLPFAAALAAACYFLFGALPALALLTGYLSHLAADRLG